MTVYSRATTLATLTWRPWRPIRNRFSAVKPGHVWTDLQLYLKFDLHRSAHGARIATEGFSGLRLAGLLMFGRADAIRDAFPHYMVDYQERPEPKAEPRWIDRIVPDGMWSGNVYDFWPQGLSPIDRKSEGLPFSTSGGAA